MTQREHTAILKALRHRAEESAARGEGVAFEDGRLPGVTAYVKARAEETLDDAGNAVTKVVRYVEVVET